MEESNRLKMTTTRTPYLPQELVLSNILTRLPVKSLLRFRCVCKLWLHTICDPNFIASHFVHAKANPPFVTTIQIKRNNYDRFFFFSSMHAQDKSSLIFRFDNKVYSFWLGDCNGLVCFLSNSAFLICNPNTHELLVHPFANLDHGEGQKPRILSHGFGFDHLKNEYKVVQIVDRKRCMVYTLGVTNSWRDITATSKLPDGLIISRRAVHSNGALYWLSRPDFHIISFDIHYEKFQVIPDTPCPQNLTLIDMVDRQGSLCVVFQSKKTSTDQVEINLYTLLKDKKQHSWVKESIQFPFMYSSPPVYFYPLSPTEPTLLYSVADGFLTLFNPNTQRTRMTLKVPTNKDGVLLFGYQVKYQAENLLSLKTLVPPGASQAGYVSSKELWDIAHRRR